jgi:RimJ/RimL family protein N-acetyltransferase
VFGDGVVTLRRWREADAAALVECIDGDAEIFRWLDQVPQPYTIDDALAYVRDSPQTTFAITDAESGRILGSIGIGPAEDAVREIGYWLRADARGRGAATRALVLVSRWALEQHDVARLQLRADVENAASCRVAERAAYTREGVLRSAHWNPRLGRRQDYALYSLLPGELS